MHRVHPLEGQGADRTGFYAFAAMGACCFGNGLVFEGGNPALEATPGESDSADPQSLATHPHAFPAENTFIGIVDEE